MKRSEYSTLKRRRAQWRAELTREPRRYPLKLINATIAALTADIIRCLTERSP